MKQINNLQINTDKYLITKESKQVICELHGEYTQQCLLIKSTNKEILSICPTCKQLHSEQEALHMIKENQDKYSQTLMTKLFDRAGIPPKFLGRSLDNLIVNDDNKVNITKVKTFIQSLDANLAAGGGLIMFGGAGLGKSHLSCAIAQETTNKLKSVLFITADEIIDDVKGAYSDNSSAKNKINSYIKPDLLIIDEITAGIDSRDIRIIAKIINARYSFQKSMIVITNLDLINYENDNEITLAKVLGERLIDRFRETNVALKFTGKSFRSMKNGSNE